MKKLSVIRLERYRTKADWQRQGLLPSELEVLLSSSQPGQMPARESQKKKRKMPARPRKRS